MAKWAEVMDQVVRERRPALVGYAYLVCGSRSDAEEITQEAIVRTFARGRTKTSVAQIGVAMKLADGTVKRYLSNAAAKLRGLVEDDAAEVAELHVHATVIEGRYA